MALLSIDHPIIRGILDWITEHTTSSYIDSRGSPMSPYLASSGIEDFLIEYQSPSAWNQARIRGTCYDLYCGNWVVRFHFTEIHLTVMCRKNNWYDNWQDMRTCEYEDPRLFKLFERYLKRHGVWKLGCELEL